MLLGLLRALLRAAESVIPMDLICPISGALIQRPAEWTGSNIPGVGDRMDIKNGEIYDYEALVYFISITLKRGEAGVGRIRTDTSKCQEMQRRIREWTGEENGQAAVFPDSDNTQPAPSVLFGESARAMALVRQGIEPRLGRPLQSGEEYIPRLVFNYTTVNDEWLPTPAMLDELLIVVVWKSSPALRFRVYGEFAQIISPQLRYEELGQLPTERKQDAEYALRQEAHSDPAYVPFDDFLWRVLMRFARERRFTMWESFDTRADFDARWKGEKLINFRDAQR